MAGPMPGSTPIAVPSSTPRKAYSTFSGALLFWGAAFALGSRHYVRDAAIAFALSFGTFYLFALGLGIVMPPGILRGIL